MQNSSLSTEFDEMLGSLPDSEAEVLASARSLEARGNADEAVELLEEAGRRCASLAVYHALAALLLKHQRFEQSAAMAESALTRKPDDVASMLILAEAQLKIGRVEESARALKRAESLGASRLRVFKIERQLPPEALQAAEELAASADADLPEVALLDDDPPTNELDALDIDTLEPDSIDPDTNELDTNELDSFDTTTLESTSLERSTFESGKYDGSAFESGAELDESDIFGGGSFTNLSSLQMADDAATVMEDRPENLDETLIKTHKNEPADPSVDNLLVDLGLPLANETADDHEATRSVRGRIDEALGLKRDDLEFDSAARNHADSDWENVADTEYHVPDEIELDLPHENPAEQPASADINAEWPIAAHSFGSETAASKTAASETAASDDDQDETHAIELHQFKVAERDAQRPGRAARHQPTAPNPAVSSAANAGNHRAPLPADQTADNGARDDSSPKFALKYLKYIVPAILLIALLAVVAIAGAASSSAADAVHEKLSAWRTLRAVDTYQNYQRGEKLLAEALVAHGFLGESLDSMLAGIGLMGEAEKARDEALAELVHLRAMLEYRYEYSGTRNSKATIERAEAAIPQDPRIDVARAYRLLAESRRDAAIDLLGETRKQFPGLEAAAIALIHAQLDAGNIESASMAALPLRKKASPSVHVHYLLGLVDQSLKKTITADARFRHIVETLSPSHISARISRSYSLRQTDNPKAAAIATDLLKEVFGPMRKQASPFQLALAHVAMGKIHLAEGAQAEAEENFQRAIKAIPQRSSVYVPIIELYINDGRLDKALQLIKDAAAAGVTSPQLVLHSAEIYRLTGRPKTAIQTINAAEIASASALWQKGMALNDLGRTDDAAQAFAAARKLNERFAPAHAFELLLQELGHHQDHKELDQAFEKLLDRSPQNPHVLRAAASALLHVARVTSDRDRRPKLVERAEKLLLDALKFGGNPAVLHYDLCRRAMFARDSKSALEHCDKAHKLNPRYLPGLLTMAQLQLRLPSDEADPNFFEKLAESYPDDPRVSDYRALNYLNHFQVKKAEAEINRWAGTPSSKTSLHLFTEGRLAFARGAYTSALGYFQRAHTQSPALTPATLYFAQTLTRLGESDRAEKVLEAVLHDPEWEPLAWIIFGEVRRDQERLDDALQNLEIALRKLDDSIISSRLITQAYVQRALTYAAEYGYSHRRVERELERAAEHGNPNDPALNMALSRHYLALRRPDRDAAAAALEKVIEAKPFHCDALTSLQAIYDDLDEPQNLERIEKQIIEKKCED
jgi:tetratricopeptide (TPR) repeat protein